MSATKSLLSLLVLMGALTGCGQISSDVSSLLGANPNTIQKTPCPGDHDGFFVCMSANSTFSNAALEQTIEQGLTKLATLVNSSSFQGQINSAFSEGASINEALSGANYIVTVTGYCDASSDVLANAVVGGDTINYNECTVQNDANGQPDLAIVTGVLLHEISHNVGYTHPAVNPSPLTVPYWLGDTAQDDIDPNDPAGGSSSGSRKHYSVGD